MKDVRIDSSGQLRCWNCGSASFTEKRTFRAKATGVVGGGLTLGLVGAATPLLTKKKLRCRACGKYNDVGSAKAEGTPATLSGKLDAWVERQEAAQAALEEPDLTQIDAPAPPLYVPARREPITVKGHLGSVTFDGEAITVTKSARGETVIPLPHLMGTHILKAGMGMAGVWFATPDHHTPPPEKHAAIAGDPRGITFQTKKRGEFDALVAAIEAQRVN